MPEKACACFAGESPVKQAFAFACRRLRKSAGNRNCMGRHAFPGKYPMAFFALSKLTFSVAACGCYLIFVYVCREKKILCH